MSVMELKEEAIRQFAVKVEETEDEQTLKIILEFLQGLNIDDKKGLNLSRHYHDIKMKYPQVLKKLAE